jgi:4-hydroxybenzoate polyprenyltransferase
VQFVYFTLAAAILYLASHWIVDRIEMAAGKRFEQRGLLFFGILLALTLVSFTLIRSYTGNP